MTSNDAKRLHDFYSQSLKEYGDHAAEAVQWSDKHNQNVRFDILTCIVQGEDSTLLDVGCGVGDLFEFIHERNIDVQYTGIDLMPEFIKIAKERHPGVIFEETNFEDFDADRKFDYVVASGTFSFKIENHTEYYYSLIKKMYQMANKGVAFNMLNRAHHVDDDTYATYDPQEVADFCKTFCEDVHVIVGYLPQDFTIYLYK